MFIKVVVVVKNRSMEKKKFSMISKLEMILFVEFSKRKNILFYGTNVKLTKYDTFNDFFLKRIVSLCRFLPIFLRIIGFS